MSDDPKTVLVVEDDREGLEAVVAALEAFDYRVLAAHHGREAIGYLDDSQEPDLILLDLMMPVMDGWQFLEEMKKRPRAAGIPVVILSAEKRSEEIARKLGVAGFLSKPVDLETLLSTVERLRR